MRRRIMVALLAITASTAAVAPTTGSQAEQPVNGWTEFVQPKQCEQHVSQAHHRWYVHRVYRRAKISDHARHKLDRMRMCARSEAAARNMRRLERQESHQRKIRASRFCGSPACNRRLGMYMADRRYGRGAGACLDSFIRHESGWVLNISYGGRRGSPGRVAWGIPQALPPQKMASAGPDWATNPATQIRWLLSYVRRYGGPCGAAAFWRGHRYY